MGFNSGKDKLTSGVEVLTTDTQLKLSYDASNSADISVTSNGSLSLSPTSGFTSTLMLGYRTYGTSAKADGDTLSAADSGVLILQSSGSIDPADMIISLPATVAGITYTFVYVGIPSRGFRISPNANDKIQGSVVDIANGNVVTAASNGDGADNKDIILDTGSKIGDRITLVGDGANGWVILDGLGSWSFES
jgi:hypothetical protein